MPGVVSYGPRAETAIRKRNTPLEPAGKVLNVRSKKQAGKNGIPPGRVFSHQFRLPTFRVFPAAPISHSFADMAASVLFQLFEVTEHLLSLALGILQKRDSAFKKSIQGMWTLYVSDIPCTFLESTSIGCFEGCLISKEFAPALSFGKAPVSRHMFSAK